MFVYTEPRSADQNSRRPAPQPSSQRSVFFQMPNPFRMIFLARSCPLTPIESYPCMKTSGGHPSPSSRNEKLVTATPLDSALLPRAESRGTNCNVSKSFSTLRFRAVSARRIRSYEDCRGSMGSSQKLFRGHPLPCSAACKFAPLFSPTCRSLLPQPLSFHAFALLPGAVGLLTKDSEMFLPPSHVASNYAPCFHALAHSLAQQSTRNPFCNQSLPHSFSCTGGGAQPTKTVGRRRGGGGRWT
jgi:hypothetical protein